MILECPNCGTRYLVQIGLFAQGGRKVRCARCKHEWHVTLPTSVDVVMPAPEAQPTVYPAADGLAAPKPPRSPGPSVMPRGSGLFQPSTPPDTQPVQPSSPEPPTNEPMPNLPAVISKKTVPQEMVQALIAFVVAAVFVFAMVAGRNAIVRAVPGARIVYESMGFSLFLKWEGLAFVDVKSELRYDGGTMKLFVDGAIHNTTQETKAVPDIKARALAADGGNILIWSVPAPAGTIKGGEKISFHTEIASSMERTIEDVLLEFVSRKDGR